MTQAGQSLIDTFKKFGTDLGLPKVDVEKIVETHRKNIEAMGRSAEIVSTGATSIAAKQRELMEAVFTEISAAAKEFKPVGDRAEAIAKHAEFAKKAFELAVNNTRDIAELANKSATEVSQVFQDRLKDTVEQIRGSVQRPGSDSTKESS
jgi:phasin family protein